MTKKIVMTMVFLGACICIAVNDYLCAEAAIQDFKVVDGDSLTRGEERIRILNIDAPEYLQYCQNAVGDKYMCGQKATEYLREMVAEGISCKSLDVDRYGRTLAECYLSDGTDIGRKMVLEGWAVSYGDAYDAEELEARKKKKGIWQGKFMRPELFRALKRSRERQENKKM